MVTVRSGLLVLSLGFLALGCSPPAMTLACSASTCGGCCQGDQCLSGSTVDACGAHGLACFACPSSQVCGGDGRCAAPSSGGGAAVGGGSGGGTATGGGTASGGGISTGGGATTGGGSATGGGAATGGGGGTACADATTTCTDLSGMGNYACATSTGTGFPASAPTCTQSSPCATGYSCWVTMTGATSGKCLQDCTGPADGGTATGGGAGTGGGTATGGGAGTGGGTTRDAGVDLCMGVPTTGRCATPTTIQFCSTATGNSTPSVQTYTCPSATACNVADAGFQSFAQCVAQGVCVPGATQCTASAQLQTCDGTGSWVTTACPAGCVVSGLGSACKPAGATSSFTGSLQYQARSPNSGFTDWNTTTFNAAAQGFLVLSFAQGQVLDATVTNTTGGYTIQVPAAPAAGDHLAFAALGIGADGGVAYMVANPNLDAGVLSAGTPTPNPKAWVWTANDSVLVPGGTLTITEAAGSGAARIFDFVRYVHGRAVTKNGAEGLSVIAWLGYGTSWDCGSCMSHASTTAFNLPFDTQIWFNGDTVDQEYWSDAVTAHELGHWAMNSYGFPPLEGGLHCVGWPDPPGMAWSEGWATWHSSAARHDPRYYDKQGGSMFYVDLSVRQYSTGLGATWVRPVAANGLLQDLDENELSATLWSLSSSSSTAEDSLWSALRSPRMTDRMYSAFGGTSLNLRGYTWHTWASACPVVGRVDTGRAIPALPDFLDALVCQGFSASTIDLATNPTVNYPYVSSSPLCQ